MQTTIGTVYGVLLNDRASLRRLAYQFESDPYKAPPKAPVLYIKPANTWCGSGATVRIPEMPGLVQVGATIAAVIGRTTSCVAPQDALDHVTDFRLVADLCLPHDNFFRPAIKERCRDGFCVIGDAVRSPDIKPDETLIRVIVNGAVVQTRTFNDSARGLGQLIADVTEFMTLDRGDLLLLGLADEIPLVRPGDQIMVEAEQLGTVSFGVALETDQAAR